ncbi:MAG: phosphomannomutase/phosphoglucomutase [Maricaulaceae bacterium]
MKPRADLHPNTYAFETEPLVKPTGFREYDARWWFGAPGSDKAPELNLLGVQALGLGLAEVMSELGVAPKIVVGHDFRSYSQAIKQALCVGLMNGGVVVPDIGLALSPMAYFAQFALDAPGVAMVTASHNENGWTGVKMGVEPPLTFGPEEMSRLKTIVLGGLGRPRPGGGYVPEPDVAARYIADLTQGEKLSRPFKVVAACGNGTAGAFAPKVLEAIGADVIPMDCALDHTFPRYNPNPEDLAMLHALRDEVLANKADLGLAFDGDGDRCGVVDNTGEEIFADKVGVLLARDFAAQHPQAVFVVDVKSTGLYNTDPVLKDLGATTEYYKTGHSYIKRRTQELGALAGFEKSGHYFFQAPIGRGYDDGLLSGIAVLRMLDRAEGKTVADLRKSLPKTWSSPTMSPYCADEEKYAVVDRIVADYEAKAARGDRILDQAIASVVTVNGVRFTLENGAWGLIRASSNTPNLVVVVESPNSADEMIALFGHIKTQLGKHAEIGAFDQELSAA